MNFYILLFSVVIMTALEEMLRENHLILWDSV